MSELFLETISKQHQQLLKKLGAIQGLTLVGGTALALQLGHRKSFDLDFITTSPVTQSLVSEIQQHAQAADVKQRLLSDTQYTAVFDGIHVTCFQETEPFFHPVVSGLGCRLAAMPDIFSTKLYILGRRATWRDYVDIALCLEKAQMNLGSGIDEAIRRYAIAKKWILEPLGYFDDVEMTPIQWVEKQYSDSEIQHILQRALEEYLKK